MFIAALEKRTEETFRRVTRPALPLSDGGDMYVAEMPARAPCTETGHVTFKTADATAELPTSNAEGFAMSAALMFAFQFTMVRSERGIVIRKGDVTVGTGMELDPDRTLSEIVLLSMGREGKRSNTDVAGGAAALRAADAAETAEDVGCRGMRKDESSERARWMAGAEK